MNLEFDTTFYILPKHCNHMYPLVFGGALFSEMDICAASCVKRLLYDSECDAAVTHKVTTLEFNAPSYSGDLLRLNAKIVGGNRKSIILDVIVKRDQDDKLIAQAQFIFVSMKDKEYCHHGLNLKDI